MRDILRPPLRVLVALALALAACGDVGLPVLGWDASAGCSSNADCVSVPGRPVCETQSRRCVQCTPAMDSACTVGQYCDAATFTCVPGCRNDGDCVGTPATPRCDVPAHRCVQCLTDDHCPNGERCVDRACRRGCDPDAPRCGAGEACCPSGGSSLCLETRSDVNNCGGCGVRCRLANATPVCTGGRCQVMSCETGFANCNGDSADGCETNLQSSTMHCGACGNVCPAAQACVAGVCVCPTGQTLCGGSCIDTQSDRANCGSCGTACPAAQMCVAGACVCPMGQSLCGGSCIDAQTDRANCGACGNACPAAQMCVAGVCACAMGQTFCAGRCVDARTDRANCGTCGNACPAAQMCVAGACACPTGLSFCAMRCLDTQTELAHCGGCGRACSSVNGTPSCARGACGIACNAGFGNCNGDVADGCEANLNTSNAHCGACGNACTGGAACVNGLCHRFPSTGAEGPYNPTGPGVVTIPGGLHNFTTITIPAGVTVRPTGPEPLDLRATGPVIVNGIIDVSGGNGGSIVCGSNRNGSTGGSTGLGVPGATNTTCATGLPACGGQGGVGGGAPGMAALAGANGSLPTRGGGGDRGGGGGGGYDAMGAGGGGGGGGPAGGGGGAGAGRGCTAAPGESGLGGRGGGTSGGAGGTTLGSDGFGRGGSTMNVMYAGLNGSAGLSCGPTGSIFGGGGGGGSIGNLAANDLSVDNGTFFAGSGGGGGGGPLGAGGGGGGGALRVASHVSVSVGSTGQVLAQGGDGVRVTCSTGGGGGGGGSGGVIYLYAPALTVAAGAVVSADPGDGGFATGGGGQGGPGGLGRIRLSVQTGRCSLAFASFNPSLTDAMCSFSTGAGTPGTTFIRRYPD